MKAINKYPYCTEKFVADAINFIHNNYGANIEQKLKEQYNYLDDYMTYTLISEYKNHYKGRK